MHSRLSTLCTLKHCRRGKEYFHNAKKKLEKNQERNLNPVWNQESRIILQVSFKCRPIAKIISMQVRGSSYSLFNPEMFSLCFHFPCALSLFPMTDFPSSRILWDVSFHILTCTIRDDTEVQLECFSGGSISNFHTTMNGLTVTLLIFIPSHV